MLGRDMLRRWLGRGGMTDSEQERETKPSSFEDEEEVEGRRRLGSSKSTEPMTRRLSRRFDSGEKPAPAASAAIEEEDDEFYDSDDSDDGTTVATVESVDDDERLQGVRTFLDSDVDDDDGESATDLDTTTDDDNEDDEEEDGQRTRDRERDLKVCTVIGPDGKRLEDSAGRAQVLGAPEDYVIVRRRGDDGGEGEAFCVHFDYVNSAARPGSLGTGLSSLRVPGMEAGTTIELEIDPEEMARAASIATDVREVVDSIKEGEREREERSWLGAAANLGKKALGWMTWGAVGGSSPPPTEEESRAEEEETADAVSEAEAAISQGTASAAASEDEVQASIDRLERRIRELEEKREAVETQRAAGREQARERIALLEKKDPRAVRDCVVSRLSETRQRANRVLAERREEEGDVEDVLEPGERTGDAILDKFVELARAERAAEATGFSAERAEQMRETLAEARKKQLEARMRAQEDQQREQAKLKTKAGRDAATEEGILKAFRPLPEVLVDEDEVREATAEAEGHAEDAREAEERRSKASDQLQEALLSECFAGAAREVEQLRGWIRFGDKLEEQIGLLRKQRARLQAFQSRLALAQTKLGAAERVEQEEREAGERLAKELEKAEKEAPETGKRWPSDDDPQAQDKLLERFADDYRLEHSKEPDNQPPGAPCNRAMAEVSAGGAGGGKDKSSSLACDQPGAGCQKRIDYRVYQRFAADLLDPRKGGGSGKRRGVLVDYSVGAGKTCIDALMFGAAFEAAAEGKTQIRTAILFVPKVDMAPDVWKAIRCQCGSPLLCKALADAGAPKAKKGGFTSRYELPLPSGKGTFHLIIHDYASIDYSAFPAALKPGGLLTLSDCLVGVEEAHHLMYPMGLAKQDQYTFSGVMNVRSALVDPARSKNALVFGMTGSPIKQSVSDIALVNIFKRASKTTGKIKNPLPDELLPRDQWPKLWEDLAREDASLRYAPPVQPLPSNQAFVKFCQGIEWRNRMFQAIYMRKRLTAEQQEQIAAARDVQDVARKLGLEEKGGDADGGEEEGEGTAAVATTTAAFGNAAAPTTLGTTASGAKSKSKKKKKKKKGGAAGATGEEEEEGEKKCDVTLRGYLTKFGYDLLLKQIANIPTHVRLNFDTNLYPEMSVVEDLVVSFAPPPGKDKPIRPDSMKVDQRLPRLTDGDRTFFPSNDPAKALREEKEAVLRRDYHLVRPDVVFVRMPSDAVDRYGNYMLKEYREGSDALLRVGPGEAAYDALAGVKFYEHGITPTKQKLIPASGYMLRNNPATMNTKRPSYVSPSAAAVVRLITGDPEKDGALGYGGAQGKHFVFVPSTRIDSGIAAVAMLLRQAGWEQVGPHVKDVGACAMYGKAKQKRTHIRFGEDETENEVEEVEVSPVAQIGKRTGWIARETGDTGDLDNPNSHIRPPARRFIVLEADKQGKDARKRALAIFNDPRNVTGAYAPVIIGGAVAKESMDLFGVKFVHILAPPADATTVTQVMGRAFRQRAHNGVVGPREVRTLMYVQITPEQQDLYLNARTLQNIEARRERRESGRAGSGRSRPESGSGGGEQPRKRIVTPFGQLMEDAKSEDAAGTGGGSRIARLRGVLAGAPTADQAYARAIAPSNNANAQVLRIISEAAVDCKLFRSYHAKTGTTDPTQLRAVHPCAGDPRLSDVQSGAALDAMLPGPGQAQPLACLRTDGRAGLLAEMTGDQLRAEIDRQGRTIAEDDAVLAAGGDRAALCRTLGWVPLPETFGPAQESRRVALRQIRGLDRGEEGDQGEGKPIPGGQSLQRGELRDLIDKIVTEAASDREVQASDLSERERWIARTELNALGMAKADVLEEEGEDVVRSVERRGKLLFERRVNELRGRRAGEAVERAKERVPRKSDDPAVRKLLELRRRVEKVGEGLPEKQRQALRGIALEEESSFDPDIQGLTDEGTSESEMSSALDERAGRMRPEDVVASEDEEEDDLSSALF